MNIIKEILENLRPDPNRNNDKTISKGGVSKVTNKTLYNELIDHFVGKMEELSVGKRILYPMSFNILLYPDDYKNVGESLPFILPEVIAGFYAAIKEKVGSNYEVDATPPAKYWFFQFASSKYKTEDGKESLMIPGKIATVGHLTQFDITKIQQGVSLENINLSVKPQNSNVIKNNINQEALLGLEILTENVFLFYFDKKLSENLSDIKSSQRTNSNVLALLSYDDGHKIVQLSMLEDLVIISGNKERRVMENILIINSESVDVGHVQIRYLREQNKFQLCAYSKTRLNMREVPISIGGTPIWLDMSFKSNIFLNDEVNIRFKASDLFISGS